jgi:methylenetetrahydrofolate dehydrogenase (NADP+)/methenyltetrahydrofolate cyclohydrolase
MTAKIIDGKEIANKINEEVASEIKKLGWKPSLSVILVGDNPASQVYIRNKRQACQSVGINGSLHEFPADVSQRDVETFIADLNYSSVDGILVQLPLPEHLDKYSILNAVSLLKDVDCFNAINVGQLSQGDTRLKPCTPAGILEMLKYHGISTKGKKVTIINRSQVVGQPLALLLQQEPYNATVTVCHEHTEKLYLYQCARQCDILITAVGKYPEFSLPPDWLPFGGVVIDVAVNRNENGIFGDVVDFEQAKSRVKWITPVPGGCGPVTVACLMRNTLICGKLRRNMI